MLYKIGALLCFSPSVRHFRHASFPFPVYFAYGPMDIITIDIIITMSMIITASAYGAVEKYGHSPASLLHQSYFANYVIDFHVNFSSANFLHRGMMV